MNQLYPFSSESVSAGHPDKVCDQISDAILSECLLQDPASRVAIEASIEDHTLFLFGEITSRARINAPEIAKDILVRIGYDDPAWGLSIERLQVVEASSRRLLRTSRRVALRRELRARSFQVRVNGAKLRGSLLVRSTPLVALSAHVHESPGEVLLNRAVVAGFETKRDVGQMFKLVRLNHPEA